MSLERKWEATKEELEFEKLLKENGYEIIDIKEYQSKTKYKISKDGLEYNSYFEFPLVPKAKAEVRFEFFVKCFESHKELQELRKMAGVHKHV